MDQNENGYKFIRGAQRACKKANTFLNYLVSNCDTTKELSNLVGSVNNYIVHTNPMAKIISQTQAKKTLQVKGRTIALQKMHIRNLVEKALKNS